MKKILLSLGTIAAVAVPIGVVISCSTTVLQTLTYKLSKEESTDGKDHYYKILEYGDKGSTGFSLTKFEVSKEAYLKLGGK